ncbi:hypothetical protein BX616_009661 [Lobosporangium transversale]|nr:hypothetical protein BX616_009661 [Lobosporangium transversale]
MSPRYIVVPTERIYEARPNGWRKRAVPLSPDVATSSSLDVDILDPPSMASMSSISPPKETLIIIAVSLGTCLLIVALFLFVFCMRRKYALRRRIGQSQEQGEFSSTYEGEKATNGYFEKQLWTQVPEVTKANTKAKVTSVVTGTPKRPTNVHHRTRSVPIAFTSKNQSNKHRRSTNASIRPHASERFQQIPLAGETLVESEDEVALKQSLSTDNDSRDHETVSIIAPPIPTLHRRVSLNSHQKNLNYIIGRSVPIDEESIHETSSYNTPPKASIHFTESEVLGEGGNSDKHKNNINPTSPSSGFGQHRHRFRSHSHRSIGTMEFNPSQFITFSTQLDLIKNCHPHHPEAEAVSSSSEDESDESDNDDTVSNTSSDDGHHFNASTHPIFTCSGDKIELGKNGGENRPQTQGLNVLPTPQPPTFVSG